MRKRLIQVATPSGGSAPPRRWRRLAAGAVLALIVAVAVLIGAFLWGVAIPSELVRAPLERALTGAFGVPTRLEGTLEIRTGLAATAVADALVLADPAGAMIARATRPAVKIDLVALARRVVALDEVTGERLELDLARGADGRGNWAPIFASAPGSGPPPVTFGGIARLRVGSVSGTFRSAGAAPVAFGVASLDGALPVRDPVTARGTATIAGHAVAFDLRTGSLEALQVTGAPIPVQGTLDASGARITIDGSLAADGSKLDAGVQVAADDAGPLLAALGIGAHEPGRLDARARLGVTATAAAASELVLKLGKSDLAGSVRVDWGAPRLRVAADLAGEHFDLHTFLAAPPVTDQPAAEAIVALLERAATGIDAEIAAAVGALAGGPVTAHELKLTGRSADRTVAVRWHATIVGTRATATLDYDARKPGRTLAARLDGGAISTARLPQAERPQGLSGTSGAIRGQLRGQGANPRAIVASLAGSLDATDLRWTVAGHAGRPVSGRFDSVRIAVQGVRTSSAQVVGTVGGTACTVKASGGALAPLLEGEHWPVALAGSCGGGGRLNAKGRIALAQRHLAADLTFDAAADRIGPVARAFGVAPDAPHPFAARGALALEEKHAHVRLDALRLGRTAGKGEVEVPLEGAGGAPRVQLALTNADVDELATLAPGAGGPAPADPFARAVLPANVRLPDLAFDVTADTVRVAGETLRRAHAKGAVRDGRLPRTPFGFEWGGAPTSGEIAADFRGARPEVALSATAQNADLGAFAARAGLGKTTVRAGRLTLNASGTGVLLGELLESATVDAGVAAVRLERSERFAPGLPGRADLAATLKAAPGRPAALAANGTIGGEPFDLAVETPGLTGLARAGVPIPATVRASLGDARLQASGRIARDGTGDGKVELRGTRLDRLGALAGVELPPIGPYAVAGTIAVSADTIRASAVDASFGKSRLLGNAEMQVRRGGRPLHALNLRAPILHFEDLGGARWLGGPAPAGGREAPVAGREEALFARGLDWLRTADVDASIEVDAMHGGGAPFASGRLQAKLAAGVLRVVLQDVRTEGGSIDADARVDASGAQPKLALRARVDGMDFGPLARTIDPGTQLGGRLDLVADLAAQGPPGALLPALAGSIDVAVFPHDLSAGALAFWGTGLMSAMLRSLDPSTRSEVNCTVASLDVAAGLMRTEAFFVETTRVRIIGQIEADLPTRALSGRLRPVARQPELFSVAPTMVLGGTIERPSVSVAPENIVLAPLRFATPLAGFALDWLGGRGNPQGGAPGCKEAFDRARQARAAVGAARP